MDAAGKEHGRQGNIIAVVREAKADELLKTLMQILEEKRLAVKEVTMDFSNSMYSIVRQAFPNATIVIDCFHIMKCCSEALEEMRMRFKRAAATEVRKEERENSRNVRNAMLHREKDTRPSIQKTTRERNVAGSLHARTRKTCPKC